jgi:hypothetical protein
MVRFTGWLSKESLWYFSWSLLQNYFLTGSKLFLLASFVMVLWVFRMSRLMGAPLTDIIIECAPIIHSIDLEVRLLTERGDIFWVLIRQLMTLHTHTHTHTRTHAHTRGYRLPPGHISDAEQRDEQVYLEGTLNVRVTRYTQCASWKFGWFVSRQRKVMYQ